MALVQSSLLHSWKEDPAINAADPGCAPALRGVHTFRLAVEPSKVHEPASPLSDTESFPQPPPISSSHLSLTYS